MFKSGFVSIIGRPNVGKSTLLNSILKQKVAIMSNKPQTTRNKIMGIYNDENTQIVFIDTPGIHKPKSKLSDEMNKSAYSATRDVDLILFMTNVDQPMSDGDMRIINELKRKDSKVYLILNKIDLITKQELIDFSLALPKDVQDVFEAIIPISAKKDNNVEYLLNLIKSNLEEGHQYFPEGMISDRPDSFLVKELIREKILYHTKEEVPHSIAIALDKMITKKDGSILIIASIVVERDSQKGIIIGKHGSMIKKIGVEARHDIEILLGAKVYLETFVKVEKNWRNKAFYLNEFGYKDEQ